jgi:chemotaxis signal transduction protein
MLLQIKAAYAASAKEPTPLRVQAMLIEKYCHLSTYPTCPTCAMRLTKAAARPKEETLQVLVFPFKDLHLALRLEGVQKVIRKPEIFRSGQKSLGMAHFEDQEAIVIDLHQRIYGHPNLQPESHLVIAKSVMAKSVITELEPQLYGILVATLPTMMAIGVSALRPLPAEYRDRDPLGIASHIATIQQHAAPQNVAPQSTGSKTLFLLDPMRLFTD